MHRNQSRSVNFILPGVLLRSRRMVSLQFRRGTQAFNCSSNSSFSKIRKLRWPRQQASVALSASSRWLWNQDLPSQQWQTISEFLFIQYLSISNHQQSLNLSIVFLAAEKLSNSRTKYLPSQFSCWKPSSLQRIYFFIRVGVLKSFLRKEVSVGISSLLRFFKSRRILVNSCLPEGFSWLLRLLMSFQQLQFEMGNRFLISSRNQMAAGVQPSWWTTEAMSLMQDSTLSPLSAASSQSSMA